MVSSPDPQNSRLLFDALEREGVIRTKEVRLAMESVPREEFVSDDLRSSAYIDSPLSIGHGQTISAPHMVAMMCEYIEPRAGNKILEVGAGCGYHAAVLSRMVLPDGRVFATEIVQPLAEMASKNISRIGIDNVEVIHTDGSVGLEAEAPFDRISVAAGSPDIPTPLLDQLAEGGILVIPVGHLGIQELLIIKKKNDEFTTLRKEHVVFVPLRGEHGV